MRAGAGVKFESLRLRTVLTGLLLIGLIVLPVVFLRRLPAPIVWTLLLWACSALWLARAAKTSFTTVVWSHLFAVSVFLLAVELYAISRMGVSSVELSYSPGYSQYHPVLGFAPVPDFVAKATRVVNSRLVYDVRYTIGADGLREVPASAQHPDTGCTLFFGGSFIFGEGLEDAETLPNVVAQVTARPALNFSFHGYGPHQMLAAIEFGLVDRAIECEPEHAVYLALPAHVQRSAGKASWDRDGPRYLLTPDGVLYAGAFRDSAQVRMARSLLDKFNKSYAYRNFFANRFRQSDKDTELYAAIVAQARDNLATKYPGIAFHILWWDGERNAAAEQTAALLESIRPTGFYRVSQLLPNFAADPERYRIPADGHPNALANYELGLFLAGTILAEKVP